MRDQSQDDPRNQCVQGNRTDQTLDCRDGNCWERMRSGMNEPTEQEPSWRSHPIGDFGQYRQRLYGISNHSRQDHEGVEIGRNDDRLEEQAVTELPSRL
jgi:hypothetical protein